MTMTELLGDLAVFWSVVIIDLTLAGDNAIIVGVLAAGVPAHHRRQVLAMGIGMAMAFRIVFSLIAVELLAIVGLLVAGGLLLLWVAWKMWREMHANAPPDPADSAQAVANAPAKTRWQATFQIAIADVSMSLDNVLAVAGTARHNMLILAFGLVFSVIIMGVAAGFVSRLAHRYPWITYLGIAIVAFVGLKMIYDGIPDVLTLM